MNSNTARMPSYIGLIVIALFFQATITQAQTNPQETAYHQEDIRLNPSVLRSSAMRLSFQPQQIPFNALNQPAPFAPAQQGRLPMFCALEKKLNEACKLWIRFRLE